MLSSTNVIKIKLRDYLESKGTKLEDYLVQGVHSAITMSLGNHRDRDDRVDILRDFMHSFARDAEAVVDYEIQVIPYGENNCHQLVIQTGTALIRKGHLNFTQQQ